MASSQTQNYQLNQWAETDQVLRTDFNADNAKIDAALTGLRQPAFKVGVLTDYDGSADVTVDLGRQPAMVMVGNRLGWSNIITTSSSTSDPGHAVALPGYPGYFSGTSGDSGINIALEITETGFLLHSGMLSSLRPYRYLAFFSAEE